MAVNIATSATKGPDTRGEEYVWSADQKIELATYEQAAEMLRELGFRFKVQRLHVFTAADPVAYLRLS